MRVLKLRPFKGMFSTNCHLWATSNAGRGATFHFTLPTAADAPFEKVGLPKLGSTSLGHYATKMTSVIYKWLSGPILVAALLGAVIKRNWNRHEAEGPEREKQTGLKDQL